jgi:spore maturation protein CgeB
MDPFSQAAFSYEFSYVPIHPENWQSALSDPPDLLLVESSFAGNEGTWTNEIAGFCPPRPALRGLTEWCRSNGIPTVFWNKEDPANFEWFIGAASAFDWVFTVDANSIDRYRDELGHNKVGVLPFAAQPRINYPPPAGQERTGNVAFAGSYYARKHPGRREQMEMILRPALDYGLDIFDRMGPSGDPRFAWPAAYEDHLCGSLSYPQTTEAYRRYKVFLNVNTVTDSPTMCARRVFELLASGTAVVSGPARALDEMVPSDAILISHSANETKEHLETLMASPATRAGFGEAGQRWIANGNTYSDRVDRVLRVAGLA